MQHGFILTLIMGMIGVLPADEPPAKQPPITEASFEQHIKPFINSFCIKCHNPRRKRGDFDISDMLDQRQFGKHQEDWQKVFAHVHERSMPPAKNKVPSEVERERFTTWAKQNLHRIQQAEQSNDPGRFVIRRLNRLEYNNTIRDLFGLTLNLADSFPSDGGGGAGFDNHAESLFLPPILLEKYLESARVIAQKVPLENLVVGKTDSADKSNPIDRNASIERLLRRCFRRPPTDAERKRFEQFAQQLAQKSHSDEGILRALLVPILVSPNFLFRIEETRSGSEAIPINDYELASRLSYFLWCSTPDEALLEKSRNGTLRKPDVLRAEVQRMLRDQRFDSMVETLVGQWFGTKTLFGLIGPDKKKFPEYTADLRDSFAREPIEYLLYMVRAQRPLIELLESDYHVVNDLLIKHYKLTPPASSGKQPTKSDVAKEQSDNKEPAKNTTTTAVTTAAVIPSHGFTRVKATDPNRSGILGMAGVLTVSSYPQRTSPVLRGKWVLEEVFGTALPPPPPVTPGLPPEDKPQNGKTFRQRLEQHRSNPACTGCHQRIDPIGFGLENFDVLGRFRTEIGGVAIDNAGQLATGEKFKGPVEMRKVLLTRHDDFRRHVIEKILGFALGRTIEPADSATVNTIRSALAKQQDRIDKLFEEIVLSHPFQHRRPRVNAAGQPKKAVAK